MARRAGIPFGTYGALETGRFRLGLDRLCRILFALGASIGDVWPDASSDGKPVTRKAIRLAVGNAESRLPKRQTVAGILEAVARDFGVAVEDLAGPRRTKRLSEARAQAMRLVRAENHLKVNDFARALGRDPSSLSHLLRRMARRASHTRSQ